MTAYGWRFHALLDLTRRPAEKILHKYTFFANQIDTDREKGYNKSCLCANRSDTGKTRKKEGGRS